MKAILQSCSVDQRGPAFSTRQEEPDGSVSYEALSEVTLRFTVIGNDATEFIGDIKNMKPGAMIKSIGLGNHETVSSEAGAVTRGSRKYVFGE